MDILLGRRAADLARWERRSLWPAIAAGPGPGDHRDAYERRVAVEPPGEPVADGPYRRVARAILEYRVFPPHLVTGVLRRARIEIDDIVGIRYRLAPGVHLFFAARVVAKFDGPDGAGRHRAGFTYRTLVGHPELGEETFSVEKDGATGEVTAALRAWSRPGTLLARLGAPLVRRWQVAASHAALDHLAAIAAAAD